MCLIGAIPRARHLEFRCPSVGFFEPSRGEGQRLLSEGYPAGCLSRLGMSCRQNGGHRYRVEEYWRRYWFVARWTQIRPAMVGDGVAATV